MSREVSVIGVVGAGTMGSGIAQVFAQKGWGVALCDAAAAQLERALATLGKISIAIWKEPHRPRATG